MSDVNENMGPVQDQYSQTYVSQYVPMPFEVMQKKAENEQKEFDTIEDNWAVISSKMGEKVLDADKPLMKEEVNKYQNTIGDALKAVNGDWRKLSGSVKGVASQYRNFITTGEGAQAVSRLAEMTEKLEQIKDSELSGRMKKAQSNYLRTRYNSSGGVRGGGRIDEPILYDESKLADTLVGWVDKLKANKGDKIQRYTTKDANGKTVTKFANVGASTTYRDEDLGKLVTKGTVQKGVDLARIREVASGIYDLPDFKDMIDAERMVGMHKNRKVPVKNADGTIGVETRDLSRTEYQQMKFAEKFGFIDAYAYMQEESEYTLTADNKLKDEIANKKAQKEALEKQGIVVSNSTANNYNNQFKENNEKVDEDELLKTLKKKITKGNKNYLLNYTDQGQIYNTFKNNFKNQDLSSVESNNKIKDDFNGRLLKIFNSDSELKKLVNVSQDGVTSEISEVGYNVLFKRIAEGDDDLVNNMTVLNDDDVKTDKLFYSKKDADEFIKLAKQRDKITYLNELRIKENEREVYEKGLLARPNGVKELKLQQDKMSTAIVSKVDGFLIKGLKTKFDIDPETNLPYTADKLATVRSNYKEGVDYIRDNYTRTVSGTTNAHRSTGANKSGININGISKLLSSMESRYFQGADADADDDEKPGSDDFEKNMSSYKEKILGVASNSKFLTNIGNGDPEAGWEKLKRFSATMAKEKKEYRKVKNNHQEMKDQLTRSDDIFNKSLNAKREKGVSIELNQSNVINLKSDIAGVEDRQFFMKDIIKNLPISTILDGSFFTALDNNTKETPRSTFKTGGSNAVEPKDYISVLTKSISDGFFSDDIDPITGQKNITFTLNGKNFKIPFTINQPKPAGGYKLELKGYSVPKRELVESEIRSDLHNARINSLSRTPVGNHRDGVSIQTKEPGAGKPFKKDFNFNFSDGGAYKISLDPTSVGIFIDLGNGMTNKELNLTGPDAIQFLKVYKNSSTLESNPKRLKNFQDAYPRFKDMNAREISRQLVREKIYEINPNKKPKDYKEIEKKKVELGSFRHGRRYSEGRNGMSYSEGRMYSYPDGVQPNLKMRPEELDSIMEAEMREYSDYSDSSLTSEPEEEEFEPYRFTDIEKQAMSQDEIAQAEVQDNETTIPFDNAEAFNPSQFNNTSRRYVDDQGEVNPNFDVNENPTNISDEEVEEMVNFDFDEKDSENLDKPQSFNLDREDLKVNNFDEELTKLNIPTPLNTDDSLKIVNLKTVSPVAKKEIIKKDLANPEGAADKKVELVEKGLERMLYPFPDGKKPTKENVIEYASSFLSYNENDIDQQETIHGFFTEAIGGTDSHFAKKDSVTSTAWCAAFVNHVLLHGGYDPVQKLTDDEGKRLKVKGNINNPYKNIRARDYQKLGSAVAKDDDKPGDIIVIRRKGSKGSSGYHVAFNAGANQDGTLRLLGGNQKDSVSIMEFNSDTHEIISKRRVSNMTATDTKELQALMDKAKVEDKNKKSNYYQKDITVGTT